LNPGNRSSFKRTKAPKATMNRGRAMANSSISSMVGQRSHIADEGLLNSRFCGEHLMVCKSTTRLSTAPSSSEPVRSLLSNVHALLAASRVSGLSAPYDANESAGGKLIATSHSRPGAVEEFSATGKVLWPYAVASGRGQLSLPSLAQILPGGGDVLVCDSGNDRVVVIDPHRNTIVWQYGHTGQQGSQLG
jgi:hypothetical protein